MIKLRADFGSSLVIKLQNLDPRSPRFKQAQFMIGSHIRNAAIENITAVGAVDTGLLRSSIRFDIRTMKGASLLNVGAFGTPYARMVEYGGPFTDRMRRAMFARFKEEGRKPRPGKGVIRGGHYEERPFLRPAIKNSEDYILETLRGIAK